MLSLPWSKKIKDMHHLTKIQRYEIFSLLQQKMSINLIAEKIHVHKSTIYREIKRNKQKQKKEYNPEKADQIYKNRMKNKKKHVRFNAQVEQIVRQKLTLEWSPEQICGWGKLNGLQMVSTERIYQFVWQDKYKGGRLYTHLRRKCRTHRKRACKNKYRGIIPNRRDIEERPAVVNEKSRFGDLEGDTVIGRHGSGVAVTICDRFTGLLWHKIIPSPTAENVSNAIISMLYPFRKLLHTITFDNGREFCKHEKIASALSVDVFFAKPYHSWERGANENLNGLLRQYYIKGSSFDWISDEIAFSIQSRLNNRPRKRLGYLSPVQKFLRIFANKKHLVKFLSLSHL